MQDGTQDSMQNGTQDRLAKQQTGQNAVAKQNRWYIRQISRIASRMVRIGQAGWQAERQVGRYAVAKQGGMQDGMQDGLAEWQAGWCAMAGQDGRQDGKQDGIQ